MPGRLYFKIFFGFLGVIALTLFLVAGLFRFTEGERFKNKFRDFAKAQSGLVRSMVEERIERTPNYRDPSNHALDDLLDMLGHSYRARLWITDASGAVIAKSFRGPLPGPEELRPDDDDDPNDRDDHRYHEEGSYTYTRCGEGPHCSYIIVPFGGRRGIERGTIHFLDRDPFFERHEGRFLAGLVAICLSVALCIMPISWFITRRLKQLRGSALRIAEGDLSHRATVKGKDEVAGVGTALNQMADSLSRMIRGGQELTANVSHELRTPLTRIRIAEEMLREQFGEDSATHLDSIREDIDELDKLIGKLLTLSKLDLKEDPLTMEPVDMAELMQVALDRITPIADHREVTLTPFMVPEAELHGDGEALLTALGNILENGVKHASEGGWLNVSLNRDASSISVTTENSHTPLPEEELEAIFEPFRRARGTVNQGFGLGLAIARKIAQRHGGTLHAENCNDGVRFVLRVPKNQPDN